MVIENRENLGMIDNQTLFNVIIQSLAKVTLGNGVVANTITSTALKVTQKAIEANRSVDVQLGGRVINDIYLNMAFNTNVPIAESHPTLYRRDLIIFDHSAGVPSVVQGTDYAINPKVPDVTDDNDIPLAIVSVNPAVTVINTADIIDVRSFTVPVVGTGKYTMVGLWVFPIRKSTDEATGSGFLVTGTTYGYAGYARCILPSVFPSGTTLVAVFKANLMEASNLSYVRLYNDTDLVQVVELSGSNTGAIPHMLVSAELTTGAGNNLVNDKVYVIQIKNNTAAVNSIISAAWVEFYAKTP